MPQGKRLTSIPRHSDGFIPCEQLTRLLLLVEHGRLHCKRRTGTHYWPSPDWKHRTKKNQNTKNCLYFSNALLCAITYLYTTALSAPKAPTIRSETRESELNEDIKEEDKVLTETRGWTFSCSTWVTVLIQIFVASQSKAKTVWKRAGSPLARESLSGRVHQSSVMTVINENQSMLVVSSVRTADGHV